MKVLKSLAVLAVVITLGLFVYLKVYKNEEARRLEKISERKLVRFDLDSIESFVLVRPDSSVSFERGVGRIWRIISPVETEADKEPIYKLFNTLHESDILYTVEEEAEDFAPYGLVSPEYYLSMKYTDGSSDTLFVGNDTPDGTMSYVKYSSDNRVLTVSTLLTDQLKLPVNSYRTRTVLNVISSDITSIDIYRETPDKGPENLVLTLENGVWWMDQPWRHPASKQNVTEFVQKIADALRRHLIEEHPDDLEQYGLQNPRAVITVTLRHNMPNKVLLIGNEEASRTLGRFFYAKQLTDDLVFGTNTDLPRLLERSTSWFIDNQPLKFNRNIIDRIELNANDQKIVFLRDNAGNWNVISPVDQNIQVQTIDTIYALSRFVQTLELVAYEPTEEDVKRTGLDNPRFVISFFSKNQPVNQIYFGNSFTTDRQNTYIRTDISQIIYTIGAPVDTYFNEIMQSVFGS